MQPKVRTGGVRAGDEVQIPADCFGVLRDPRRDMVGVAGQIYCAEP